MRRISKFKGLLAVAGLAAALTIGVACSNSGDTKTPDDGSKPPVGVPTQVSQPDQGVTAPISQPAPGVSEPVGAPGVPVPAPDISIPNVEAGFASRGFSPSSVSGFAVTPQFNVNGTQTGVWVTGTSVINMEPDLAILNLGVETDGKTVSEARGEAAAAMDAIVNALRARGIEDKDIQTRFFNISPMYQYNEVFEDGRRVGKQELVGYRVNNSATVKIRDMDAIGGVIDEVAEAGGDATRINGVTFTVEDPKAQEETLRELAVNDAIAKAEQFAELTNVNLGRLVFITELGGSAPVVQDFARLESVAASSSFAPTPINVGETSLSMTVQAVFNIE